MFPSRYEGFGIPCLEARLSGSPLLVSDGVPATELLLQDKGTAVVDFTCFDDNGDEKKREFIVDLVKQMQSDVLKLENRDFFSWDRHVLEYHQLFSELLGRKSLKEKIPA